MNRLIGIFWNRRAVCTAAVIFGLLAGCSQAGNQSTLSPQATIVTPVVPVTGNQQASPTTLPPATQAPAGDPVWPTATIVQAAVTVEPTLPVNPLASIPDPAGYTWAQVASNLDRPIGMANAGDGSERLFILEQAGRIRVIENGSVLPDAFLDIVAKVGSGGSEQGLLGLAFHPDYPQNPHFYVNYTDKNGDTVISNFQVSGDPNLADPASEKVMIQVDQPFANHNGGSVVFGPDGYLYLGLGDGGSGGDPYGNGQSLDTLLGKILRIDVNQGDPYAIPPDNPFAAGGGKPEIWAYGLRNPWRFSFDRQTNDLLIADVGQNAWEEVNFLPAGSPGGANFGWNYREGAHAFANAQSPAGVTLIDPIWEYSHAEGGCSITGGMVYRGQNLPAWKGVYLAADYCSGLVWGVVSANGAWQAALIFETSFAVTSFGEDEAGEIYLLDHQGGVYRLEQKG